MENYGKKDIEKNLNEYDKKYYQFQRIDILII